ncbi:hypothetical protein V8C37DRAFT_97126 [Trichoderma ceciliae]
MASSSTAQRGSETQSTPNGTTGGAAQIFSSLLTQVPNDPAYSMNFFLGEGQIPGRQHERPPLGLAPTESKAEVEARVLAQLRSFDALFA